MTTHTMAITYKPKEFAVMEGVIRQTIRVCSEVKPKKVGDRLLLHGWEGRPYRSPWSWRRDETLEKVIQAGVSLEGIWMGKLFIPWEGHIYTDYLAELDGIDPPTGEELGRVLTEMHGIKANEVLGMEVLRW